MAFAHAVTFYTHKNHIEFLSLISPSFLCSPHQGKRHTHTHTHISTKQQERMRGAEIIKYHEIEFLTPFLNLSFAGRKRRILVSLFHFSLLIWYFIHIETSLGCQRTSRNNDIAAKWCSFVLSSIWIKIHFPHLSRQREQKKERIMFYLNCMLCAAVLLNSCHIPHHWMERWKSSRNCILHKYP